MGRNNSNQNKRQTTNASTKQCPKQRNNSLDQMKSFEGKNDEGIHGCEQSTSKAMDDTTDFMYCSADERIEDEHLNAGEECTIVEDKEYLMEHIQILLDAYPNCNFVQQILQKLCDDGTLTEEMIAKLIDRSIQKLKEIERQINVLKSNHIKKSNA
uniref:CUE domain-containing protein n=1 Tax=Elaeophora elaphi TaxID=1147741 RepID=A0A0R3S2K4_9BILA